MLFLRNKRRNEIGSDTARVNRLITEEAEVPLLTPVSAPAAFEANKNKQNITTREYLKRNKTSTVSTWQY